MKEKEINRKFHVATEKGSTFFDFLLNDITDVSKNELFFKDITDDD
jgi:hypothetical protein